MATVEGGIKRVSIQSLLLNFLDNASTQYGNVPPSDTASTSSSTATSAANSIDTGVRTSAWHAPSATNTGSSWTAPTTATTTTSYLPSPHYHFNYRLGDAAAHNHHHYHHHNGNASATESAAATPIPLPPIRLPLANTTNTNVNRSASFAGLGPPSTQTTPIPVPAIPLPENIHSYGPRKRKLEDDHTSSTAGAKRSNKNPKLMPKAFASPSHSSASYSEPGPLDVSSVSLAGEPTQSVRVFDTCDTIRRKIRAMLRRDGITQAGFLRAIASTYADGRKIQNKQLNDFLAKKGPLAGNRSCIFYASYVFFEKLRIRDGKEKDRHRVEMERQWGPDGVDTVHDCSYSYSRGEGGWVDEFGGIQDGLYERERR